MVSSVLGWPEFSNPGILQNPYHVSSNEDMALNVRVIRFFRTAWLLVGILTGYSIVANAQPPGTPVRGSSADAILIAGSSDLPDEPEAARQQENSSALDSATVQQARPEESEQGKQTKRILGIVPNFSSVSANSHLAAQSPKEKFDDFVSDSFDYSSFVFIGILSGVSQVQGSIPEFHSGAPAYARYYWHSFADQTDENLWVGFLLPVALREDARYYTLGSGTEDKHNGFLKRAGYAFTRILVTRTDSGGNSFNFSEVVGAGAAAGISNLYYPASNRTWTKTGQRWALNVGIDGGTFIFKEFWPDINHAIFHTK